MVQSRYMAHKGSICKGFIQIVLLLTVNGLAFGQGTILGPGVSVTGQCSGHGSQPGCVLPTLFGENGLTLFNNPVFPHYAHFVGSAQTTLNQTLSTAIATQLAILPIISPSSGFTYEYNSASGAFVRSNTTFGPIYTERADTIGRGKFYFGMSYQRFRFGSLDGINLHKIPAVFSHQLEQPFQSYEADVIQTNNNVDLNMDQTMIYGTVGVTDRIDISLAVPIVSVRMGASSDATIVRVSGPTFIPAPGAPPIANPHQFTADPNSLTNTYSSNGSATGIGDVTIRVKGKVYQGQYFRVAAALDIRTPTGNARDFLGSGAAGLKPFIAISGGKRFEPHVNLGYQWNGSSILAGNITGRPSARMPTRDRLIVTNGPATKQRLPGQFFYSAGADYGLTNRVTLAVDYLGQTLFNAPRAFQSSVTTLAIPGGTGALTLPTITGGKDTIGLNSGAVGVKINIFGGLLLTGDILFRLDNKGLRQDITPLIALSYAFSGK